VDNSLSIAVAVGWKFVPPIFVDFYVVYTPFEVFSIRAGQFVLAPYAFFLANVAVEILLISTHRIKPALTTSREPVATK
jgi:hypothetical protein